MSYDLDHMWSGDLVRTASGALNAVTGTTKGEQRVLRRLMTNPGTYIWHLEYGAGLPRYVGANLNLLEIEGVIRSQIALEAVVASVPVPVIQLQPILNGIFVTVKWVDADTGEQAALEFDVTP